MIKCYNFQKILYRNSLPRSHSPPGNRIQYSIYSIIFYRIVTTDGKKLILIFTDPLLIRDPITNIDNRPQQSCGTCNLATNKNTDIFISRIYYRYHKILFMSISIWIFTAAIRFSSKACYLIYKKEKHICHNFYYFDNSISMSLVFFVIQGLSFHTLKNTAKDPWHKKK